MAERDHVPRLVSSARAGDELAFGERVRRHQNRAVAYATAILRDRHLAEDAAQEAFVEAYRERASLREPAAFGAWLRTIVFKHCDRLTRRRGLRTSGLESALHVASSSPSPYETLEARETRRAVRDAIRALSEADQQAVLLFYMGGCSYAEISGFLGVITNAVKTRLYSARQRLRRHMDDIERQLERARPSNDPQFADRIARLIQPEALEHRKPLLWSPGMGSDVWALFCACITGDLDSVTQLLTPLHRFAGDGRIEEGAMFLDHGAELHAREPGGATTSTPGSRADRPAPRARAA